MFSLKSLTGPSPLVLQELSIDKNAEKGKKYVTIRARKAGIIAWLLGVLQIDNNTIFEVYKDHIRFTVGDLTGRHIQIYPLASISVASSGYFKPILTLVIGAILGAIGLYGVLSDGINIVTIIFMLASVLMIYYYFKQQTLQVGVIPHSGIGPSMAFKSSIIEGVDITPYQACEVIEIINDLILHQQRK